MRHWGYLLRSLPIRVLESGLGLGGITIREFFPFTSFVTTGNAIFLTRHLHGEVCSYTLLLGLYFARGLSSAKAIQSHHPSLSVNLSHFEQYMCYFIFHSSCHPAHTEPFNDTLKSFNRPKQTITTGSKHFRLVAGIRHIGKSKSNKNIYEIRDANDQSL